MTRDVISLHPEDSLNHVEHTFVAHQFHHIPITEVDGSVAGIVSKSDLLQIAAIRTGFSESDFRHIKVKDFMSRQVVTVKLNDTLEHVAEMFRTNKFHALPVLDDGRVVGIVTTHDVINAMFIEANPVA